MRKLLLQVVFWSLSVFFGFKIYSSISDPIRFKGEKIKRYSKVIEKLEMVRDAQLAYKTVQGVYAADFGSLIKFIDTAKYIITQQRDTSWMEYDKVYRIDMLRQGVVVDTLGYSSVKDSLFRGSDIYKSMMLIPGAKNKEEISMKTSSIVVAGRHQSVFVAKVPKEVVLWDQPEYLVREEKEILGVGDIDGPDITVGSLEETSTAGNWPSIYDSSTDK